MIEYGVTDRYRDVTIPARLLYVKGDQLVIPAGDKRFNSHFGDHCPGIPKHLKITINPDGTNKDKEPRYYILTEDDVDEYVIDLKTGNKVNNLAINKYLSKSTLPYYKHLIANLSTIHQAYQMVQTLDSNYFDLTILNPKPTYDISVVMTTYNRSRQTYYTLATLERSNVKDVQVIIVDDSTVDPIDIFILKHFNLSIYHLKPKNKFWFNPCINYNLGFRLVEGDKIIIQNAEVCHIGDVMETVKTKLSENPNSYLVFDVNDLKEGQTLYDKEPTYQNIISDQLTWYQHHQNYNRKFHFLTAISADTFKLINGFDYDFAMGSWYDDNELVFRIEASQIKIINIPHTDGIMGTHQWHVGSSNDWDKNIFKNYDLLKAKEAYFTQHQTLFKSTDYSLDEAYDRVAELFNI